MARTKGVNKSKLIREYLAQNPDAPANDVVEALKAHKVKANLVYFLKGKMKATKQRKKRVFKAATAASSNGFAEPISLIRDVRALAHRAGGYEKLKELVDALVG